MLTTVPVLEVSPAANNEVELSFVPLEDIDDFLEDVSEDYDLGLGELGSFLGKASKVVRAGGKFKLNSPLVSFKAKLKAPKISIKAAAKTAGRLVKKAVAQAKAKGKKVAPKKVKALHRKLTAKVHSANKAKQAAVSKAVTIKATVKPGKFPKVPLNQKAILQKAVAKKTAGTVVALAPAVAAMKPAQQHAVAAALKGMPQRPAKLAKPVAKTVKVVSKMAKVRPAIIAQRKPIVAALGAKPELHARYQEHKRTKTSGAMPVLAFRITVHGLLNKLAKTNTNDALASRIERMRRVTGVRTLR